MFQRILLISSICGLARSSGVAPVANGPIGLNPIVTAASSQYFERTYNRLVVPPVVAPVPPVPPPLLAPVVPVAPTPTVFVKPTNNAPGVSNSAQPQDLPVHPNVAIAVATAHAAAPVATILLPPYPFGLPPGFGIIHSEQPNIISDENTKEPTTQRTTTAESTTEPEAKSTTPINTSSTDNGFVQALPSNENVNFKLHGVPSVPTGPQQQPTGPHFNSQLPSGNFQPPHQPTHQFKPQQSQQPTPQFRPQQPQPHSPQFQLQQPQFRPTNPQFQPQQSQFQQQEQFPPYPPKQEARPQFDSLPRPNPQARPQIYLKPQSTWPRQKPQKLKTSVEVVPVPLVYITPPPLHKTHGHVKVVKHIYSYVPVSSSKIILKPVKIRPVRLVKHKILRVHPQKLQAIDRDIEVTTFNPFPRPNTKPPRV